METNFYFLNQTDRSTKSSSRKDTVESSSSTNTSDGSPVESKDENLPPKWTRNKWNEFVKVQSTSNDTTAAAATTSNHTSPEKCQNSTSSSSSKVDAESAAKSSRGRPRKPTVTAEKMAPASVSSSSVRTEDENSMTSLCESTSSKVMESKGEQQQQEEGEGLTSSLRRRGRPPKTQKAPTQKRAKDPLRGVSMSSLELLHQKTLESIGDSDVDPRNAPRGCVAQKICIYEDTVPIPAIQVTNEELIATDNENVPLISPSGSESSAPLVENPKGYQLVDCATMDEFLSVIKYSLQNMLDTFKCPQYGENLKKRISNEEVCGIGYFNFG